MPFVYILRCNDGTLYTGAAKDLARRLAAHAAGKAARYTRSRLPVALAWSVEAGSWGAALAEEHRIKRLPRARKLALIGEEASPAEAAAGRGAVRAAPKRPAGRAGRSSRGRGPSVGSPRGSRPGGPKAAR
jgi:putative endonuclease